MLAARRVPLETRTALALLFLCAAAPLAIPAASAHQVDSVDGKYRIQIGWMQEPAVSGEPNGIDLYVSPLDPSLDPEDQDFADGITGLQKDLKIQLVLKGDSITLPLRADHNVPGKYFALVEPTVPGYYQVNVVGGIGESVVSKSLHAPRVEDERHLLFPPPPEDPILKEHDDINEEVAAIRAAVGRLEAAQAGPQPGHVGIALGAAAIAVAAVVARRR